MTTTRVEACSDGVIAIILAIMVLELHVPEIVPVASLYHLAPSLAGYLLSFVVVASMWINHHHLLHAVAKVDGGFLWLNLHLLFWMSLVPFSTSMIGRDHHASLAVAVYAANMAAFAAAFLCLRRGAHRQGGPPAGETTTAGDRRAVMAIAFYAAAVPMAWVSVWISIGVFVLMPALYFVPERHAEPTER